jgi:hypothetical protein
MMRKALQTVGGFVAFVFVLYGVAIMAMGLQIISRPPIPAVPGWSVYFLDFKGNAVEFQMGCVAAALGLTFFWFQSRDSK